MTHLCTVRLAAEAHRPTELSVHICMGLAAQAEWHVLFKSDVEVRVVVGGWQVTHAAIHHLQALPSRRDLLVFMRATGDVVRHERRVLLAGIVARQNVDRMLCVDAARAWARLWLLRPHDDAVARCALRELLE